MLEFINNSRASFRPKWDFQERLCWREGRGEEKRGDVPLAHRDT